MKMTVSSSVDVVGPTSPTLPSTSMYVTNTMELDNRTLFSLTKEKYRNSNRDRKWLGMEKLSLIIIMKIIIKGRPKNLFLNK